MKKKLIIPFVAFLSVINICFGQEKIEKYCEITVISQRVSINIGNPNAYFRDSTLKNTLLSLNKFNNAVDVLDFMSKLGWSLISTTVYGPGVRVNHFYFKKVFDKSEFTIDSN